MLGTPASTTDRDAARILLSAARERYGRLARVWADGRIHRPPRRLECSAARHRPGRGPPQRRDTRVPGASRRWVVERSFAWCLRSRRLVRDYERRTDTGESVILWSMTMLMSRRLAAWHQRPAPRAAQAA
ncbi:transposase [Streptomyces sp. NPDC002133]|uniref:transposase n=1 Tax=Streptomyces sp. NPDC002133 TaxID=3154409 RepID=UPI00331B6E67